LQRILGRHYEMSWRVRDSLGDAIPAAVPLKIHSDPISNIHWPLPVRLVPRLIRRQAVPKERYLRLEQHKTRIWVDTKLVPRMCRTIAGRECRDEERLAGKLEVPTTPVDAAAHTVGSRGVGCTDGRQHSVHGSCECWNVLDIHLSTHLKNKSIESCVRTRFKTEAEETRKATSDVELEEIASKRVVHPVVAPHDGCRSKKAVGLFFHALEASNCLTCGGIV